MFANYLTRGFWGDEAWTSLISQLPYQQMLKTTAADFHPPGYYTVIELFYKFLPPTEIVTRTVSILFYLLTIWMVYLFAQKFKGGHVFGLVSALVVAVNPIFFTYAFEARNYTMFAFAATASCYFLSRLSEKFSWGVAGLFILFSTLGIYTHYYMFFILASQGLYILLFDRRIFLKMMLLYIVVALLYLPWIPFLYAQVTSVGQSYWIGSIDGNTYREAFERILAGEHDNFFKPVLFRVSAVLLVIGILQHILRHKFEKPYLLIWLWAVVPFVLASLPGLKITEDFKLPFRPIFFWRYLVGSAVPLSMVIVHAAQKFRPPFFKLSIAAIVVLSVVIDGLTFVRSPYTFREVYDEEVLSAISPSDKIVTILPSFAEVYYYKSRNGLENEFLVLNQGLVQSSGKSLLDAYVANGRVKVVDSVSGSYFEFRPGQKIKYIK